MALRSGVVFRAAHVTRRGSKGFDWLQRHYERKAKNIKQAEEWEKMSALPKPSDPSFTRPRAFLELSVGSEVAGRITVELASDLLPKTSENFVKLCTGEGQMPSGRSESGDLVYKPIGYKGSTMHQIMKNSWVTFGDIFNADGTGGHSGLGQRFFEDEGFFIPHTKKGILSMVSGGVDQNSSIFLITLKPLPHLNGRNVAFGHIVEGMSVLDKVSKEFAVRGKPVNPVRISDCGIVEAK